MEFHDIGGEFQGPGLVSPSEEKAEQRRQSQAPLGSALQKDQRQHPQAAENNITVGYKTPDENGRALNRGPEGLEHLHLCIFSTLDWTRSWATWAPFEVSPVLTGGQMSWPPAAPSRPHFSMISNFHASFYYADTGSNSLCERWVHEQRDTSAVACSESSNIFTQQQSRFQFAGSRTLHKMASS